MSAFDYREGETPIDDISGLIPKNISLRRQLSECEAANILKATLKYLASSKDAKKVTFDYSWALQLHGEMFEDVWTWAGQLRKGPLTIGVPVTQVETSLYNLMADLPFWKDLPIVQQAAMLHHRAVEIHPFENGNGRWSRMLANIWLMRHETIYTHWPEDMIGETSVIRKEYLAAIKAADTRDFAALVDLHQRYMRDPSAEEPDSK